MLQVIEHLTGTLLLFGMLNPDFGQALIRWHLPDAAGEVLALHAAGNALRRERIRPGASASRASSAPAFFPTRSSSCREWLRTLTPPSSEKYQLSIDPVIPQWANR